MTSRPVGVDHQAAVDRGVDVLQLDGARVGIDVDARHFGEIGTIRNVERDPDALPGRADTRGPAGLLNCCVHDRDQTRVVRQ